MLELQRNEYLGLTVETTAMNVLNIWGCGFFLNLSFGLGHFKWVNFPSCT